MNTLIWSLWLLNGLLAYVHVRRLERDNNGKWTQFDRLFWLWTCLFGGTVLMVMLLIIDLGIAIASTRWAKREARW